MFEQVFTVIFFLVLVVLDCVFVAYPVSVIDSSILWVIFVVTYLLLFIMVYDYLVLTCTDPVDDLLLKIDKEYRP